MFSSHGPRGARNETKHAQYTHRAVISFAIISRSLAAITVRSSLSWRVAVSSHAAAIHNLSLEPRFFPGRFYSGHRIVTKLESEICITARDSERRALVVLNDAVYHLRVVYIYRLTIY